MQHVAAFWDGRLEYSAASNRWEKPRFCPNNDENSDAYRIKPEPKLRPWNREEVPVGAIVGFKNGGEYVSKRLIVNNIPGCILGGKETHSLGELLRDYDHSIDGGKTWKPCGVEE